MHEHTFEPDLAILAAADTGAYDPEISLDELEALASAADIATAARVIQKRENLDRATCVGAGKLEEIAAFAQSSGANLVIFDHELSATQLRNIESACGIEIMDRTMLILEIFAQNAYSAEGRLQVELARHKYLLPRLSGLGKSLSRLGGGGGGSGAGARRGKGETKLELDRRHIRRRIDSLQAQLDALEQRRELHFARRKKDGLATAAIVGYTNVGKSSLLNALTDAGVLVKDQLFATLDPTARALTLPDGRQIQLIDTVGLVRRLPHHLVEAFKSTLAEAVHADLLLNVCDLSNPEFRDQIEITGALLAELGVRDTPILQVLNKSDLAPTLPDAGSTTALVSAKTGAGLEELLQKIARLLPPSQQRMTLLIPYDAGNVLGEIRQTGKIFSEDFDANGTIVDALVDVRMLHKVQEFRVT